KGGGTARGLGSEAARGARADVEQRDFFERARGLEIGDKVRMADESRIGGARSTRESFERIVEFALRPQRLLALRLQRMLEHRSCEQLHLVQRRALVGIF